MRTYRYVGLTAFEPDDGTLWIEGGLSLKELTFDSTASRKRLRKRAGERPFVWFVDDELGNRKWFRDAHQEDFAVVTFSDYESAVNIFRRHLPCDAVVTDIFFPKKHPETPAEAKRLLSIYDEIDETPTAKLPNLWRRREKYWSLDGFKIADAFSSLDFAEARQVPVFLFSRKALFLLRTPDFPKDPKVTSNTFWLIEKHNPKTKKGAEYAAQIQRDRIKSVLQRCGASK